MSDNVLGKVQVALKGKSDVAAAIKQASSLYVSGAVQDALGVLQALPDAQKTELMANSDGKRLLYRIVVNMGASVSDAPKYLGIKE
jgi:hypothetical protein